MSTLSDSRPALHYQDLNESYREFMSLASDLGRLPSDAEFYLRENGVYPDECPELPYGDYFEPDDDEPELPDWEPEPIDRSWWAEQLALLESQRPECLNHAPTLAILDASIIAARAKAEGHVS